MADGVVVTGQRTGQPTSLEDVAAVRSVVDGKLLLVGSGVTADTVHHFLEYADGAIVGTHFKVDGILANPVDEVRVKRLIEGIRS